MNIPQNYLESAHFEFRRYKSLGDRTFAQLGEKDILWKYTGSDNNISQIVKHLSGNMLSRWTNFLTEDGEKDWRDRDMEFKKPFTTKKEMIAAWEKGWQCLFEALASINETNFETPIRIRGQEYTIIEAINRQMAHYANHVGQIVLLGKMIQGEKWVSLSIPKGKSQIYNTEMFNK